MLTASGLQKRFGARRVLRGLDLAVEDGEVVLLQGENGAGKSTLLRSLTTLDRADSGEAEVDGFPLGDGVEVRSRIGFTGHRPGFYGELSGRENLALCSGSHQVTLKQDDCRKLYAGTIVHISPPRVSRVIGKQGSMITLIRERTGCRIQVGQNGFVWIDGEPGQIARAQEAIETISREATSRGLTEKIEKLLE